MEKIEAEQPIDAYYPEKSILPPYKKIKPFSERKPEFKYRWSETRLTGVIIDEVEQEELLTWPDGTKKLYKHVLQLIHFDNFPPDKYEIRFGYYKTDFENNQPTKWNWGQFAPAFEKEAFLCLMQKDISKWGSMAI